MREIDLVALAGLLHDIGKFAQRTSSYKLRSGIYSAKDYRYTHAAYTAQVLNDLVFNIGDEMSDASAMHHNPKNDLHWVIAAADRMASGFEREIFEDYNARYDSEDFRKQRLWYLFEEGKESKEERLYYPIAALAPQNIFPIKGSAADDEYDRLWEAFSQALKEIKKEGTSVVDHFTIDYLMQKYTTLIPSSTTFKKGDFAPFKANIPLYDHGRATAIFAAAIYKLKEMGNENIINYYRHRPSDIEANDLLYISGDFFGIQQFIFGNLSTAKAAKILRAKSAYIQILTRIIAMHIVQELGLSYQSIISTHAGKFEILGINTDEAKERLKDIQRSLDDFFIKRYFALSGIGLSAVPCSLADFILKENDGSTRYQRRLRHKISQAVEERKFRKFDLTQRNALLPFQEDLNNQNLCGLCLHKKGKEQEDGEIVCDDCNSLVKIGTNLAKRSYLTISRGNGQIELFANWYISFSDEAKRFDNAIAIYDIRNDESFRGYAKWELASYVAKDQNQEIITLDNLAKESVSEGKKEQNKREYGLEALMALKGDVDSMGEFIKQSGVTASFARYNFFARMMDYFFSLYTSTLMDGKPLYTVFAGGDDIFILGAWDSVLDFAKLVRNDFVRFAKGSPLTISMGMVISKAHKPVSFIAKVAQEALELAKELDGKDGVSLFGETVKWEKYLDDKGLSQELAKIDESEGTTAFLYRLLEFTRMSEQAREDPRQTIWKSKFAYTIHRNMQELSKNEKLLSTIDQRIENYPKESRMILSEFIYKRRRA